MNIKNRIKKLESRSSRAGSFCVCFDNYWTAAIDSVYDNLPFKASPLPESDFCEKCQRAVNPTDRRTVEQVIEIYGDKTAN